MKKFNYTALKLVLAISILLSVVFLFYYSFNPFINFSKGSYILQKDLINCVFLNQNDLFGLEFTSENTLTEFTFVANEEGMNVVSEQSLFYSYKDGMITINNIIEYFMYGKNFVYKDSNHSLLEKVY